MIYSLKLFAIFSSVLVAGGAASGAAYMFIQKNKTSYLFSLEQATSTLKTEISTSEKTIETQKALLVTTQAKIESEKSDLETKTTAYKALLTTHTTALETQEALVCKQTESSVEPVEQTPPTTEEKETLTEQENQSLDAPEATIEKEEKILPETEACLISEYLYSDLVSRRKESAKLLEKVKEAKKTIKAAKEKLIVKAQKDTIKTYWKQTTDQITSFINVPKTEFVDFQAKINAARSAEREFSASKFLLQASESVMEGQKTKFSTLVPASIAFQEITHASKESHSTIYSSKLLIKQKEEEIKAAEEQIKKNEEIIKGLKPAKAIT